MSPCSCSSHILLDPLMFSIFFLSGDGGGWWRRSVMMTISDMTSIGDVLASSCMELVTAFCDCVDFR
ncbi:hypothetical protein Hanom_Chr13g01190181 [Helianthus anomalus]